MGEDLIKENLKHQRICFVLTDEINDLNFHFFIKEAEEKIKEGHFVTFLLAQSHLLNSPLIKKWQKQQSNSSIHVTTLNYHGPRISSLLAAVHSYHIFWWLLKHEKEFNCIHFSLIQGLPYYSLVAKRQGWAFQQLDFCLNVASTTLWQKQLQHQWINQLDDLALDFLEKESLRLADQVIYSCKKVFQWMQQQKWLFPHDQVKLVNRKKNNVQPLVSICLIHFNRPDYLAQALESIHAQDYSHFEVILVDDASTLPEAHMYLEGLEKEFKVKNWQIIRHQKNLFPGAARNCAVFHSQGEYVLFMDDDNYAKPNQLSFFMQVAQQVNADILTCAMDVFEESSKPTKDTPIMHRFLPLGAAKALGLYLNVFGDINALIKKEVYQKLRGLTEEQGVGAEDWEFFSRAVLEGYHLQTIPKALFWYRKTPNSITASTCMNHNYLRGIRPYLESIPIQWHANVLLSQAQHLQLNAWMSERNSSLSTLR